MSRKKGTSRILEKAEIRAAGLKAVDEKMDFGDARNLVRLNQMIEQLRDRVAEYNAALAVIDSSKTDIKLLEKDLGDLLDQMLIGVAFKYGKDSSEYEKAGGVRKSERIRRSTTNRLKANADSTLSKETKLA
jgi:hypothetical protein